MNSYCETQSFQYEDINTVLEVVQPKDKLVTVDIKSGFHHIPVSVEAQKYLGFCWGGRTYSWTVLPFGLCVSPYYFCKTLRPVISYLRQLGLRAVLYVDDFLLCADAEHIEAHTTVLLDTLKRLGLQVNWEKSSLAPACTAEYIGYLLTTDNEDGQVRIAIPKARIQSVRHDIKLTLKRGQVLARGTHRRQVCLHGKSHSPSQAHATQCLQTVETAPIMAGHASSGQGHSDRFTLVEYSPLIVEWLHGPAQDNPRPTDYRCQFHWLGWGSRQHGGTRPLEHPPLQRIFQSPGDDGRTTVPACIRTAPTGQISPDRVGQCFNYSLHQLPGRSQPRPLTTGHGHLGHSRGLQHDNQCQVPGRVIEYPCRFFVEDRFRSRLETQPKPVPLPGSHMGATSHRPICVAPDDSATEIQQSVRRPDDVRSRCPRSTRLGTDEQLCVPPIPPDASSTSNDPGAGCGGYSDRSPLAISAMVSHPAAAVHSTTHLTTTHSACLPQFRGRSGTAQEPKVEDLCLESIWQERLQQLGWSPRAYHQLPLCWAACTLGQYNRYLLKLQDFCVQQHKVFPPSEEDSALFADFLCSLSDQTPRPESQLRGAEAAITYLYEAVGVPNPMSTPMMKRLHTALVKSGTKQPARRSKPMPVQPFHQLFQEWPDNAELDIKRLRLKTLTLLSLVFMARPSDFAPKGRVFIVDSLSPESMVFNDSQVTFNEDGSMTINFFGIKNDTNRGGFEVRIPGSDDPKLNRHPQAAIQAAKLGGQGYSAKSFRPTGASVAVSSDCPPNTAMQIGRWKTNEVFYAHYVYPRAPQDYTTRMLNAD